MIPGRFFPRALRPALCALILTACATQPPAAPLVAPQWDAIPAGVLDVLCSRLRIDAIAGTSELAIVDTTRPVATGEAMSALVRTTRGGRTSTERITTSLQDGSRRLPIMTEGSSCSWRPVAENEITRNRDVMLVELSAPLLHPTAAKHAGLFARVTVGGEGASWYWIALAPAGDGWRVGSVTVLVQ